MPYPKTPKEKEAASKAFAICSKLKGSKRESCLNKVYSQEKITNSKKNKK